MCGYVDMYVTLTIDVTSSVIAHKSLIHGAIYCHLWYSTVAPSIITTATVL